MMRHRFTVVLAFVVWVGMICGCATLGPKGKRLNGVLQTAISGTQDPKQIESELDSLCAQAATAACALRGRSVALNQPLAIIQGVTTSKQALFAILVPRGKSLTYLVLVDDKPRQLLSPLVTQKDFSDWQMDQVQAANLSINENYELWLIDDDGVLWDRREFKSLNTEKSKPRLIVASCLDDSFAKEQAVAWDKVRERKPDVIFLIGDTSHTDKYANSEGTNPQILWNRHVDTRNLLAVFRWPKLVPVLATWDDHDYGLNDGDSRYPFKNESQQTFTTFFPRPQSGEEWLAGPGVGGMWNGFSQRFLFLDNRSFRSPNNHEQRGQTHFGDQQNSWIMSQLKSGTSPVWLISGDQFFGGYHKFESFEGSHPVEFLHFTQRLKKAKAPFVLLSGDRRMTELMKLDKKDVGLKTYEMTSSGLHGATYPQALKRNPNSRRIAAAAGPLNFMELEPRVKKKSWQIKVRAWGLKEGLLFERLLKIGGKSK